MNILAHPPSARNIAVIGAGISGMGAAYALAQHHRVTLYESGTTLGGHARTVMAGRNGDQPVDTGFIVFNYANYPHLCLFGDLAFTKVTVEELVALVPYMKMEIQKEWPMLHFHPQ